MNRGQRTLAVVRSIPAACPVCRGDKRVRLVAGASPWTGADARSATTRCPHCVDHAPAIYLPWHTDPSTGGAA